MSRTRWWLTTIDGNTRPIDGDFQDVMRRIVRGLVARHAGFDNALPVEGWVTCVADFVACHGCGIDGAPDVMKRLGAPPLLVDAAFEKIGALEAMLRLGAIVENGLVRYNYSPEKGVYATIK